jgi:hypothetical protein
MPRLSNMGREWPAILVLGLFVSTLGLSCGGGSQSSTGGGGGSDATWTIIPAQPPNISAGSFLLIDGSGNFFVSSESAGGMYVSRDHGNSWNALNQGFVNDCHAALALNGVGEVLASDMSHSNVAGCSSAPNHLYRLPAGSTSWVQATPGFSGFGQWPFYTLGSGSGARIFAGGAAGGSVYISTDGGNNYTECAGCPAVFSSNTTAETFDVKPGPGGFLYVGTAKMGVFYSADNGDHWTQMPCNGGLNCAGGTGNGADNKAFGLTPTGSLLVARASDQGSVACYGPQPPPAGTWMKCDSGLAPGTGAHPGAVIADIGAFWLNASKTKVFLAANSGAGHIGNVYSSADGTNWERADSGLPNNPNAINFAVDPTSGLLYVLVKGSGIYRTTSVP